MNLREVMCYRLDVCVTPKFLCGNNLPKCDGVGGDWVMKGEPS